MNDKWQTAMPSVVSRPAAAAPLATLGDCGGGGSSR